MESVYEQCVAHELNRHGIAFPTLWLAGARFTVSIENAPSLASVEGEGVGSVCQKLGYRPG